LSAVELGFDSQTTPGRGHWPVLQYPQSSTPSGCAGDPNRRREPKKINSLSVPMVEIADSRRLHHQLALRSTKMVDRLDEIRVPKRKVVDKTNER
jgi:hypothetical protein